MEKGREKCHQYWPYDTEPVYYGDIQVSIITMSLIMTSPCHHDPFYDLTMTMTIYR